MAATKLKRCDISATRTAPIAPFQVVRLGARGERSPQHAARFNGQIVLLPQRARRYFVSLTRFSISDFRTAACASCVPRTITHFGTHCGF